MPTIRLADVLGVFSASLLAKVITALVGLALIRFMSPPAYADYIYLFSSCGLAVGLVSSAVNRFYIVEGDDLAAAGPSHFFGFVLLLSVIVLVAVSHLVRMQLGYFLAAAVLVCGQLFHVFAVTYYQKQRNHKVCALIEATRSVLLGVLLGGLVLWNANNTSAASVILVHGCCCLVTFAAYVAWSIDIRKALDFRRHFTLIVQIVSGPTRYLFVYFALLAVLGQIDVFFLRSGAIELELAAYGSAFKYYGMLVLGMRSINSVYLPAIQAAESKKHVESVYRKHWQIVLLVAPAIALLALLAAYWIPFVDQGKYPKAIAAYQVLSVSAICTLAFNPYVNVLMTAKAYRTLCALCVSIFVASLPIRWALIHSGGAVGAATSTAGSLVALNFGVFLAARRIMREAWGMSTLGKGEMIGAHK